jgi:predicted 2-oxoglutarate/Fe(II)-dependent dioxygenase YbiX
MKASPSNIVRIQNFISKTEAQVFIDQCNTLFPEENQERAIYQVRPDDPISGPIAQYITKVKKEIEYESGFRVEDLTGTSIRKWCPGEEQDPHGDCEAVFFRDDSGIQMEPINNPSSLFIEYAALTYLNDDYEGGEIYFPEYDMEIKPKAGTLVFFPGSDLYTHGVRPITSGTRYAIMTFFTTPKLVFLWRKFVLDTSPLVLTDRTQNDPDITPIKFTRSSVPKDLKIIGGAAPGILDRARLESKQPQRSNTVESIAQPESAKTPLREPIAQMFGTDSSMIKIIDDHIPQDNVEKIMKMSSRITEWNYAEPGDEWHARLAGADKLRELDPDTYEILEMHAKAAKNLAEKLYNCTLKFREPALVRYRAGMHQPEAHADKQNLDGTFKEGMGDWDLSVVMYFNNDFEGGELVFPQHNVKIAPTPGRIVVYPGDDAYLHYVDHVTAGVRWACPLFFTVLDKHE